jgi:hypothetical protein
MKICRSKNLDQLMKRRKKKESNAIIDIVKQMYLWRSEFNIIIIVYFVKLVNVVFIFTLLFSHLKKNNRL